MIRKFSCGRLIINKDGVKKKIELVCGGGVRDCTLSHIDMGFDEIHDRLREVFSIDPTNRSTKLYDFAFAELDTNRYQTFFEYVQKNGLKFKGALLYLGTPADNETSVSSSSPEKSRTTTTTTPIRNPVPVVRSRIPQVEADSSTSPVLIKINDSPPPDHKPTIDSELNNRVIENLRISSSTSFSNYSFVKSLNELIDYLRNLIKQYNHESIFIQLFEDICTLRGLSSIILDQLKEQKQPVDQIEKQLHNNALEKIENLSRSIKALIELNKMKISHIDQHSIIIDSFTRFHQNFKILHKQWINNRPSTSASSSNHPTGPAPSASRDHSTTNHPIAPAPSTSSSSSRYHSTTDHPTGSAPLTSTSRYHPTTNRSTDPAPSTSSSRYYPTTNRPTDPALSTSSSRYHSTTNHPTAPAPSTSSSRYHPTTNYPVASALSTSSSRYHSTTNSRKQSRPLSPSPHRSYRLSAEGDINNENYPLFKNLLKSLDHLSDVLHNLRFTSFNHLVKSIINEIELCRSNIKLSEYRSLHDTEPSIIAIEKRLTDRLNDEYHRVSPHGIHGTLQHAFDVTLDEIKHLLDSLYQYQSHAKKNKRPRTTRWSPLEPPSTTDKEHIENKPIIDSHQQQTRIDDDDDQSSEASHSSFGDDVLMEVARGAYEQRPNRYR